MSRELEGLNLRTENGKYILEIESSKYRLVKTQLFDLGSLKVMMLFLYTPSGDKQFVNIVKNHLDVDVEELQVIVDALEKRRESLSDVLGRTTTEEVIKVFKKLKELLDSSK